MIRLLQLLTMATLSASGGAAAMITGSLTLRTGSVVDHPSIAAATGIVSWVNPTVSGNSGDFVGLIGANQPVNLVAPWSFESGPVNAFWSVAGFIFDLTGSHIVQQDAGTLTVTGTGYIRGNGFDPTPGSWNYGQQSSSAARQTASESTAFSWFSLSVAPPPVSVPVGGATAFLLFCGLGSLGLLSRAVRS